MIPLKIAFLWHFHQPYYKIDGEFFLPWTRLHGIKDYLDLALLLFDFPKIRQTFNIVPSMLLQIEEHLSGKSFDKVYKLTKIQASELTDKNKIEISQSFFICNEENMIKPYPRFYELFNTYKAGLTSQFSNQDWLDIQILYNLSWFGPISREKNEIQYLINKGRGYSETDKNLLLEIQDSILSEFIPTIRRLERQGQIELSISPMFHPILPLLCNSDSALEALPGINLPNPAFRYPQDAEWQINSAVNFFSNRFGHDPGGMWPSEGSISDESLNLIAKSGIKWVATDELVLMKSLDDKINRLERFFPRKYGNNETDITIFFRDHLLSDLIGFSYSGMNPEDAAQDFINRLKYVRWEISSHYGEDSLSHAVIPIILDGENCWEFYPNNGIEFLRALYSKLSDESELLTTTFSETMDEVSLKYLPAINHIRAGSWINADFRIWIGQDEHVRAWNYLREVREIIEQKKDNLSLESYKQVMDEFYISEGSDWFWWYFDAHQAPNKKDFDVIFRKHLINIYLLMGLEPPDYLQIPISTGESLILKQPEAMIYPDIENTSESDWQSAGCYNAGLASGVMHSVGEYLNKLFIGNNEEKIFIRMTFTRDLNNRDFIELNFNECTLKCHSNEINIINKNTESISILRYSINDGMNIELNNTGNFRELELKIITKAEENISEYPRQGNIKIQLI